jgi:hypothetical protein
MAKEFNRLPHEIIELELADWSFNLFCLNESSKDQDNSPQEYSEEAKRFLPKDKVSLDKLSEYSTKLPMWGLNNG